jgi:PhoH-like ATPase
VPRVARKIFILDTSVLVYHEDSIHAFPDSDIILPIEVLEEIDKLKTRHDSVGNSARYINRFLDDLRSQGSLKNGVKLQNGQKISVFLDSDLSVLPDGMIDSADNRIIAVALQVAEKRRKKPILISRDINMRVKCDSLGVKAENYVREKAKTNRKEAFTGVSVLKLSPQQVDTFYEKGKLENKDFDLFPNEYLVLKGGKQSALAVHKDGYIKKLKQASQTGFNVQGITPRNKEQAFAMDMVLDEDIHMATLTGRAGSGKTLISIASAVHMVNSKKYDKIIISRPVQSTSGEIGFLPGTKYDKMEPWIQPIVDNFKIVFGPKNGDHYFNMLLDKGIIEIESLAFIRGRSLPNTIFILDESQNITYKEAKAVTTRMGENSKLVLLGDLEQIDAPHLDSVTSGLGAVVEKFKDFNLSAHITLLKGERSPLAAYAARIL